MTFEEYDRFCQEKERAVAAADEADGWYAAGSKPKKATTPDPFHGLAVEAWLARKNPVNSGGARAARQKELEAWLGETPRRAFTSKGYKPYKNYASAGRSSVASRRQPGRCSSAFAGRMLMARAPPLATRHRLR